jgi:transcriptional regulator with XRE-family HTH domain
MAEQAKRSTPSRFVLARMRRGLRPWQVADALGLSRRRVLDIEHGRVVARDEEIEAIAEFLRFPTGFFFRPHIDLPVVR